MQETINYLIEKTNDFKPELAVVLGSGLGAFCEGIEGISIPYSDIVGFAPSTVVGHKGELLFANAFGKRIVVMQGRFHFYEGNSLQTVTYPIKIFKKLGVKTVILTNAAGSLDKKMKAGSLMLIKDHINFIGNPLIGKNDETLGTRFPSMNELYTPKLRELAKKCAKKLKIKLNEGVYCALSGPSYETPSEVKMFAKLGGNATGMSTAPEAIVAKYCGLEVLAISLITNMAAGLSKSAPNHKEVVEMGAIAGKKLVQLLGSVIEEI